jgi:hypothetical protein
MERLRSVSVPDSQLQTLFDNVTPETIHRLAQEGALRFRDMAAFLFGSTDLPAILRSIALIGRNSRLWMIEESLTPEHLKLRFYHHVGMNYSMFLAESLGVGVKKAGGSEPIVEYDEHTVTMKMPLEGTGIERSETTDWLGTWVAQKADGSPRKY